MEIGTGKFKKGKKPASKAKNGDASEIALDHQTTNSMLENMPINVMLADLDGQIIYVNPKSRDTLLSIESELPVRVAEIMGGSYDVFHKNPAHQRKLLGNEKNLPHRATISVGKDKLDLLVSAARDVSGNYIGPMVTWEVVTEKLKLEEAATRTHNMMENAPVNIIMAGKDLVISYMNPKSLATLKGLEKFLPIPIDKIVGSSVDVFHKNPEHQRRLLSNPANLPHRAMIKVGPETLDLLVSAIYDVNKNYIGPMLTWEVVTEKLKLEEAAARAQNMLENAPVNVMMADMNFTISYQNPRSLQTLRTLEKHLPVSADKVAGQSIDLFHKNPDKQRRILSDPRNLPHRAKIKVGPETLDLLVSAIYDKSKNYLGPMVTWEVITNKLQLVESLEATSNQLGSAAEELSAVATQMSKNAGQTAERSTGAAASSEEVAKGVQTVATNTEEMLASIKEIAKSSADAAGISKDAMKKASETNATITELGDASQEIGNVIKVISSIAQQTNLLALNATIEAARAGDAGKGFAVVANEVKELAKQTAKATEDITNRIGAIQESSKGAVTAIGGISSTIEQINSISMTIAAAVEEQTATTNEVSRVIQESNSAVNGIATTVKAVAGAAQESSTGAAQTLDSARGLAKLADGLKELIKKIEV